MLKNRHAWPLFALRSSIRLLFASATRTFLKTLENRVVQFMFVLSGAWALSAHIHAIQEVALNRVYPELQRVLLDVLNWHQSIETKFIFTVRKQSLGQGNILQLSVIILFTGGGEVYTPLGRHPQADTPQTATESGGMQPTGMHSCYLKHFILTSWLVL